MVINLEAREEQERLRKEMEDNDEWEEVKSFIGVSGQVSIFWHSTKNEVVCEAQEGILAGEIFRLELSITPKDKLHVVGLALLSISSSFPFLLFI